MALDLEAIRKKLNQLNGTARTSSIQMWKADARELEYKVRCLPWKNVTDGQPFIERQFYYLGDGVPGILAPAQFGKPDPINDLIRKLYSTKDQNDRAMAKSLMPKTRVYAPIIVRGEEEKGVLVWAFNYKIHQDLLGFILDSDYGDIIDPESARDIKVKISVSKKVYNGRKVNDMTVQCSPQPCPLSKDPEQAKKWLEAVPNIDDMWPMKTYEEIKVLLQNFLEGGQEGVVATENADESAKAQNDELSKLQEEIKAAQEAPAADESSAPVMPAKRRPAKKAESSVAGVEADLDRELESLKGDK